MFTFIYRLLGLSAVLPELPYSYSGPIVQTTSGTLQGIQLATSSSSIYYAFKGIPYAEPPVDELRFKDPVPHLSWEGVRNAAEHGSACPNSILGVYLGNEDCLFLNVYTPNLFERKAVMVWIHGGGFILGSGDSLLFGPDYLIQQDILVVTLNYRLGVFGFLSTEDSYASGNFAIKDIILALQWIKDNILAFGGDPDNITIFGQSAGGALVHYLVLSPLANGLYHKAIAQSGTALSPWAYQPNPRHWAFRIGEKLGIQTNSTEELVTQLRKVSAKNIAHSTFWSLLDLEIPRLFSSVPFAPSIDSPESDEQRVITDSPRNLMARGEFNKVPFMLGYTDAESLLFIHENTLDSGTIDALNANQHAWIPNEFNVPHGSADADQIVREIKDIYLGGQELSEDLRWEWTKYCTDRHFIHGIDETVKAIAALQDDPVYYYVFSYTGPLNLIKNLLLLRRWPGAVHADELAYIFRVARLSLPLFPWNQAFVIRHRLLSMWSNFAKTGNPTSVLNEYVQVQWPRVVNGGEHINIGYDLVPGQCAMCNRTSLYYSWRDRFAR